MRGRGASQSGNHGVTNWIWFIGENCDRVHASGDHWLGLSKNNQGAFIFSWTCGGGALGWWRGDGVAEELEPEKNRAAL